MRKLRSTALFFALMLTLTSCGGTPVDEDNSLNFMVYSPSQQQDLNALRDLMKDFTEQTGIRVNLNTPPKDKYDSTFKATIARGKFKPDVAYLDQPLIATYASTDIIVPIDDLVKGSSVINLSKFNQAVLDTNRYEGKLYGLPLNMTASVLMYNKDLVSESEVPTTWDEWKNFPVPSDKALFEGIGTEGYAGWYYQAFLKNAGGELYDETTNKATFLTKEGIETATFLRDLYRNELDATSRSSSNAFINGDILFKIGSSYDIDNIKVQKPSFNLGVALMPSKTGETHYSAMGGENLVITKISNKQDKAMQLIEFLLSKESSVLLSSFTGNFPSITEYIEEEDPNKLVVIEQLNHVVARPTVPNWLEINDQYLGKALDQILNHESPRDIEDALKWAEEAANQILAR